MNKFFSYLILCFLISFSSAKACDFKRIQYGEKTQDLKLNIFAPTFKDNFGGEKYVVPIQELCPENEDLFGTTINYLFIDEKLSQIFLERFGMNDTALMDFTEKKYGKIILPQDLKREDWRGKEYWNLKDETVTFISVNVHGGRKIEILELTPKLYEEKVIAYAEKIGKWLDEQK